MILLEDTLSVPDIFRTRRSWTKTKFHWPWRGSDKLCLFNENPKELLMRLANFGIFPACRVGASQDLVVSLAHEANSDSCFICYESQKCDSEDCPAFLPQSFYASQVTRTTTFIFLEPVFELIYSGGVGAICQIELSLREHVMTSGEDIGQSIQVVEELEQAPGLQFSHERVPLLKVQDCQNAFPVTL